MKESKINLLVHNYELFSMKETETIVEMITRFIDIVNGLEALGKTYKEFEKVMKILRSLPSKWHTKVTAIQEAKDLTKLPMKELIGSLMTYEINLTKKLQEGEDKKKKSINPQSYNQGRRRFWRRKAKWWRWWFSPHNKKAQQIHEKWKV